jgi:hypothetical protein
VPTGVTAPRRTIRLRWLAAALALTATAPLGPLGAQTGTGVFLLPPIGARALALGGAVVAGGEGSEYLWWNPAALARETRREVAIHHAQTIVATSDALALVIPWRRVGVLGIAANLIDLGEQEVTPPEGGPPIGTFLPRNLVVAASFSRPVGPRLDLGLTYKLLQARLDCSGQCGSVPVEASTTSAVDVGARVSLAGWAPVAVGVAVRNAGPGIAVAAGEAENALPSRWQAGVQYDVPVLGRLSDDVTAQVSGDVLSPLDDLAPAVRLGVEAAWQRRVIVRGGYAFGRQRDPLAEAAGPSVGLGLVAGRLVVDIAREFQGLSVDAGQPPTYVTLRFRF